MVASLADTIRLVHLIIMDYVLMFEFSDRKLLTYCFVSEINTCYNKNYIG